MTGVQTVAHTQFSFAPASLAGLIALAVAWPTASLAQMPEHSQAISVGSYFARGDFGADVETRIRYFPLSYEYSNSKWTLQATASRLSVSGLGNVLVNVGGVTQAVAGTELVTQSGAGDTVLTGIYHLAPIGQVFFDLRIDAKLPTADESRALGTGEFDASVQLDASMSLTNTAVFASLGYSDRGKSSLYPGLQDSVYTQLGFAKPVNESVSIGAFYDYRQAASAFSTESHELSPYVSWQLTGNWSFTALAVFGMTDASPDTAVMGQLRYSWAR